MSEHDPVDHESAEERTRESQRAALEVRQSHLRRVDQAMGDGAASVKIRDDIREWADGYCTGRPDNLILLGPTGTGKTSQGWQAIRWIVEHDPEPWRNEPTWDGRVPQVNSSWISEYYSDMAARLRAAEGSESFMDEIKLVGVLMIDDFINLATTWQAVQLKRIFEARWKYQRPTIVTSNLPEDELRKVLPDTVESRLFHTAKVIIMRGSDFRVTQ